MVVVVAGVFTGCGQQGGGGDADLEKERDNRPGLVETPREEAN